MPPDCTHELALVAQGHQLIAGIDEVGRGCWAGPVVAAAVVLSDVVWHLPTLLAGLNDSKQLSAAQRTALAHTIQRLALGIGIGWVSAHDIDCLGILNATKLAMQQAIMSLPHIPDALLIDAVTLPHWRIPQHALIKGDARSLSIAAASVIAKVHRDYAVSAYEHAYPGYGFANHKGYGTTQHHTALMRLGPTPLHRFSFTPMSQLCAGSSTNSSM
jgi:ribonuclease HII